MDVNCPAGCSSTQPATRCQPLNTRPIPDPCFWTTGSPILQVMHICTWWVLITRMGIYGCSYPHVRSYHIHVGLQDQASNTYTEMPQLGEGRWVDEMGEQYNVQGVFSQQVAAIVVAPPVQLLMFAYGLLFTFSFWPLCISCPAGGHNAGGWQPDLRSIHQPLLLQPLVSACHIHPA